MRNHYRPWFESKPWRPAWLTDPLQRAYWTSPRGGAGHFNKRGEPISFLEWTLLFEDLSYRRIAYTDLGGGAYLSTVWLGLNHGISRGPGLQFETMDFPAQDIQERWASEEQAREGHAQLVAQWRASHAVAASAVDEARTRPPE